MQKREILLDMDGCVVDFVSTALKAHGRQETHDDITTWNFYEAWGMTAEEFWAPCRGIAFWESMQPYPWARDLYEGIKKNFPVTISTSPSEDPECAPGKYNWLRKHLGVRVADCMVGPKKYLMASPLHILIDDAPKNVAKFTERGGLAIGFKQPWNRFDHNWEDVLKELDNYVTA